MALFEGAKLRNQMPSNTKLVVSGGDSPAEKWLVKEGLPTLMTYPYYGWYGALQDVVISKGLMIAATGKTGKDYDTGRQIPEITIADGILPTIGMTPFSLIRRVEDRFYDNQPTIITREYVELPLFTNAPNSKVELPEVPWGFAVGNIKAGDRLRCIKATDLGGAGEFSLGRVMKWDPATDLPQDIIGQVLGIEDEGSPKSWLEWAMWNESAKQQDDVFINKLGYSAPSEAGYPFDPDLVDGYRNGTNDMTGYWSDMTTTQTGVKGINDGAHMSNTLFTDREMAEIPVGVLVGSLFTFVAPQKNLIEGSVIIKVGGVDVTAACTINHLKGFIGYTADAVNRGTVTITYKAKQYGTPSSWNFDGAVGAIRLLLKF